MKVLALVYPGMTLLDLVGPLQAWSFLPGYEVQYAWHSCGPVPTDCGLSVQATNSFEDAWTDPDVLIVGGGAKPTLDLLDDSAVIGFLADRGSRARWVCSVCTGSLLLGAAGLLRGYRAAVHWGAREALPPYGTGRPDLADAQTLAAARAAMRQAMTGVSEEGRVLV
jgi:cyclohexyl-isocyanide hydratase